MQAAPHVLVEGLVKHFREGVRSHAVIDGISLQLRRGEFVALVGRSGSGKSTLLNLLSGIEVPDAGRIIIDGRELTGLSERERTLFRRRHIGFVFQFFNLLPTLTVLDNLLLPLALNRAADVDATQRALGVLTELGLASRINSYPDVLSGGEQQRVAVARALVHRPALLLADEPTGNLDTETGAEVMAFFQRQVCEAGLTVLMVTHSAELAARADRVLALRDSKVSEAVS